MYFRFKDYLIKFNFILMVQWCLNSKDVINDYKLRSRTVEAHKRVYHYEFISLIGLKRIQNLMFTIVASYNKIKFFNLIKEKELDLFSVISAIRYIYSY